MDFASMTAFAMVGYWVQMTVVTKAGMTVVRKVVWMMMAFLSTTAFAMVGYWVEMTVVTRAEMTVVRKVVWMMMAVWILLAEALRDPLGIMQKERRDELYQWQQQQQKLRQQKSRLTIVGVSTKESVGDTEDEGSSEGEREGETLTDGAALGILVCWFVPVSS